MAKEHTKIISYIVKNYGNLPNSFLWPNNTGATKKRGFYMRFGYPGSPDIIGCIDGRWVGFEVKVGGDTWREDQKKFCEKIKKCGGAYFLIKSIEDFDAIYNSITSS